MKDSWITTKTKMSLTTDGRTKARHISVETHGGIIMLRGKVSSAAEKTTAEEIARGISGATGVSNALQIVPDDVREAVDKKDDTIETAIRAVKLQNSLRGPMHFDELGNVVGSFYIRRVEKVGNKYVNAVVKTYPNVSQFWTYDKDEFLKNPVYSRDWPPARNLEK